MTDARDIQGCSITGDRDVVCEVCTMNRKDEIDRMAFVDWWVEVKDGKKLYYCSDHFPRRLSNGRG